MAFKMKGNMDFGVGSPLEKSALKHDNQENKHPGPDGHGVHKSSITNTTKGAPVISRILDFWSPKNIMERGKKYVKRKSSAGDNPINEDFPVSS